MHADGDNNKLYYYIREKKQTKQIQLKIFTTGYNYDAHGFIMDGVIYNRHTANNAHIV